MSELQCIPTDAEVVLGTAAGGVHQLRVSVRVPVELAVVDAGHLVSGAVAVLPPRKPQLTPLLAIHGTCSVRGGA